MTTQTILVLVGIVSAFAIFGIIVAWADFYSRGYPKPADKEPAEAKAFVDVAKGFQEANPGVTINTDAVPSQPNHLLKLATEFAAGDPPDGDEDLGV